MVIRFLDVVDDVLSGGLIVTCLSCTTYVVVIVFKALFSLSCFLDVYRFLWLPRRLPALFPLPRPWFLSLIFQVLISVSLMMRPDYFIFYVELVKSV